jgi:NitT/TauT family transport system ATP-binding protein
MKSDQALHANHGWLEICDLQASFQGPLGTLEALEHISFDVRYGEFVCLVGPSGCGKSTLLRIVAGLLPPTSGQVYLEGKSQTKATRRIGLVFQDPTLLPWRTVQENIGLPLELMGCSSDEIRQRTKALVDLVELSGFEAEYPAHLSGGMAQRTAIARALAQNPEILLLDEPFGALDALTRERMAIALLRIWERHQRTMLMVTHSVEEAALLADRVVILSARPGRVVDIIPIDLPRPRAPDLRMAPRFQDIACSIRNALGLVN